MHTKIYFNHKLLYLTTTLTPELNNQLQQKGALFSNKIDDATIQTFIRQIETPAVTIAVLMHDNLHQLMKAVTKQFTIVKAAGGFIYNDKGEVLLIFRRGKWDLPKGKQDEGEDLATCALREVQEETGLDNVQLQQPLTITYHTYYQDNHHILKESHWYLMKTNSNQELTPQTEEDIEKCDWIHINAMASYLQNAQPSVVDVVHAGTELLQQMKNA